MSAPRESIKTIEPSEPIFEKLIYWLWTTNGAQTPVYPKTKRPSDGSDFVAVGLPEFLDSMARCQQKILIMDPYVFGKLGIEVIWEGFLYSNAPDLRVLTNSDRKSEFEMMESWIADMASRELAKNQRGISVKTGSIGIGFHDRFAILDDELWHFGSTVGGATPAFSAVTRGWSANEFIKVFEDLWRQR